MWVWQVLWCVELVIGPAPLHICTCSNRSARAPASHQLAGPIRHHYMLQPVCVCTLYNMSVGLLMFREPFRHDMLEQCSFYIMKLSDLGCDGN